MQDDLLKTKNEVAELKDENLKIKRELATVKEGLNEQKTIEKKIIDVQARSMRDNLVFYNIPESEAAEDRDGPEKLISNVIKEKLGIQEKIHFERVHRVGARRNADGSPKTGPIVAIFSSDKQKENVKGEGAKLKGTNIGMSEQFPKEIQERRKNCGQFSKKQSIKGQSENGSGQTIY